MAENGENIRSQEDMWLENSSLCDLFQRLYRLFSSHNVSIKSRRINSFQSRDWHWALNFRRSLFERERQDYATLLTKPNSVSFNDTREDRTIWNLEPSGNFSSKSYFLWLSDDRSFNDFKPFAMIWKAKVPMKIQIFPWALVKGEINTGDVIQRRNPNICLSPSCCVMCRRSEDSINHLFLIVTLPLDFGLD